MTRFRSLSRRLHGFPVELPAALLAAAAVAFWLLIAPGSWLPAQGASFIWAPPGDALRAILALVGFALAFGLTRTGLRALEPRRAAPADMPQFRKADLHPDAPRRRPIRADREFGAPAIGPLDAPPTPRMAPGATVPLPSFLQPSAPCGCDAEPIRFVDEVVRDVPDGVVVQREPVWFRPRDPEEADESGWEDADWEDAPDDPPRPDHPQAPAPHADATFAAAPPPGPMSADENVTRLMARLEAGLARRGGAPVRPARDDETRAALRAVAGELDAIFSAELSLRARAAR